MGSSTSHQRDSAKLVAGNKVLLLAMEHLQRFHRSPRSNGSDGSKFGGARKDNIAAGGIKCKCGGYYGGDESTNPTKWIGEYDKSRSAEVKKDIIRKLAQALKMAGIQVDPDAETDSIVNDLLSKLPNPNSQTFKADAASQDKICRTIAKVLNDQFSPGVYRDEEKFIDMSKTRTASDMCSDVAIWINRFIGSINAEFIASHVAFRDAIKSINLLEHISNKVFADIMSKVVSNDEAESLRTLFEKIQVERRKQEELIEGLLNVHLMPIKDELEKIMTSSNQHINGVLRRVGLNPGSPEFSSTMASTINYIGVAAHVANRVNKALKTVGLSVKQYLESKDFKELERLIDEKIQGGKIPATEVVNFIKAVDVLRYGFLEKESEEVREAMRKGETKGAGEKIGGANEYSALSKRLREENDARSIIIKDFASRMNKHYKDIIESINTISPLLGKGIHITTKLNAFREALRQLHSNERGAYRVELALIGRYSDADARSRKELFMSRLRTLSAICDDIVDMPQYKSSSKYFSDVRDAITNALRTIDSFSDIMTKTIGGQEGDKEGGDKDGGAEGDDSLLPNTYNWELDFKEAVNRFLYKYYIAGVREHLSRSSEELDKYGERYEDLLGSAVAARIFELETAKINALKELKVDSLILCPGGGNQITPWLVGGVSGVGKPPGADDAMTEVKKWINDEFATKIQFYKVVQAVDLYLKAFTGSITSDPDAVSDIKKVLDGVSVIARWFNESTGSRLAAAFESLGGAQRSDYAISTTTLNDGAADDYPHDHTHYYRRIAALPSEADRFRLGVPYIPDQPQTTNAKRARMRVNEVFDSYQGLKNLVNAFITIGDRFGGIELQSKVFMSPSQIYRHLMDFLKQSSMVMNYAANPSTALPVVKKPEGADIMGVTVADTDSRSWYTVSFSMIEEAPYSTGDSAHLPTNYDMENKYFAMIIKAMAAKILTVLGTYDMLERVSMPKNALDIRMIMGGTSTEALIPADANIQDKVAELYFRLPRLLEFYRKLFKWDRTDVEDITVDSKKMKLVMIPELGGLYSELIRIIFGRTYAAESGEYSDTELIKMAIEINRIYEFHAKEFPDEPVIKSINGLINEVNRRYGLVVKEDNDNYWSLMTLSKTGVASNSRVNDTQYSILPGENDNELTRRAPSDRYSQTAITTYDPVTGLPINPATGSVYERFRGSIKVDDLKKNTKGPKATVDRFRDVIEGEYKDYYADGSNSDHMGYALLIEQAKRDIRSSKTDDERFNIFRRMVQSVSGVSAENDTYLMFHESVVVGLNTLCAMYSLLRNYDNFLEISNPVKIESAIIDSLWLNTAVVAAQADASGAISPQAYAALGAATKAALITMINTRLPDLAALSTAVDDRAKRFKKYEAFGCVTNIYENYILDRNTAGAGMNQGLQLVCRGDIHSGITAAGVYTGLAALSGREGVVAQVAPELPKIRQIGLPSKYAYVDPDNGLFENATWKNKDGKCLLTEISDASATANSIVALRGVAIIGKFYARLLTDYKKLMNDFIENTFGLVSGSDHLIKCNIIGGETPILSLDFHKFKDVVSNLVNSVKVSIEKFRDLIPYKILKTYEDINTRGSIFWIEKHLVDGLINGIGEGSKTLDIISRTANINFKALTRDTHVFFDNAVSAAIVVAGDGRTAQVPIEINPATNPIPHANIIPAGYKLAAPLQNSTRREWYGALLTKLAFYSEGYDIECLYPTSIQGPASSNTDGTRGFNPTLVLDRFCSTTDVTTGAATRPSAGCTGQLCNRVYKIISEEVGIPVDTRSAVFAFNQLLYSYLNAFGDHTAGYRIYNQLITPIADGVLNNSLGDNIGPNCIPDLYATASMPGNVVIAHGFGGDATIIGVGNGDARMDIPSESFGLRGDIHKEQILTQSMGLALTRITRDNRRNVPTCLMTTLSDIPAYMKESYRALLPVFIKLFDMLAAKCEFIKNVYKALPDDCKYRRKQDTDAYAVAGAPYAQTDGTATAAVGTTSTVNADWTGGHQAAAFTVPLGPENLHMLPKVGKVAAITHLLDYGANSSMTMQTVNMRARRLMRGSRFLEFSGIKDREYFDSNWTNIMDNVIRCSTSVSDICADVLKELSVYPVFGPSRDSFAESYKLRNGHDPLMPLSMISWYFGDVPSNGNYANLSPVNKRLGGTGFGVHYATRLITTCNDEITSYDQFPGSKAIVEHFNENTRPNGRINSDEYLNFVKNITSAIRFILNIRGFSSIMSSTSAPILGVNVYANAGGAALGAKESRLTIMNGEVDGLVFGPNTTVGLLLRGGQAKFIDADPVPAKDVTGVSDLLESTDTYKSINEFVNHVAGRSFSAGKGRKFELIHNLVDSNIIPVNFHALMREIPLANLYNYGYTFDKLSKSIYGLSDIPNPPRKTSELFVKMLCDPYTAIADDEYRKTMDQPPTLVDRMFRGDNDLGMGRPKFLSDQVYNKALLGSVYPTEINRDPTPSEYGHFDLVKRDPGDTNTKYLYKILWTLHSYMEPVAKVLRDEFDDGAEWGNRILIFHRPLPLVPGRLMTAADLYRRVNVFLLITVGIFAANPNNVADDTGGPPTNWAAALAMPTITDAERVLMLNALWPATGIIAGGGTLAPVIEKLKTEKYKLRLDAFIAAASVTTAANLAGTLATKIAILLETLIYLENLLRPVRSSLVLTSNAIASSSMMISHLSDAIRIELGGAPIPLNAESALFSASVANMVASITALINSPNFLETSPAPSSRVLNAVGDTNLRIAIASHVAQYGLGTAKQVTADGTVREPNDAIAGTVDGNSTAGGTINKWLMVLKHFLYADSDNIADGHRISMRGGGIAAARIVNVYDSVRLMLSMTYTLLQTDATNPITYLGSTRRYAYVLTNVGEYDDTTPNVAGTEAVKAHEISRGANAYNMEKMYNSISKCRFDTVMVRNLIFITNILRVVRLKLNRELSYSRNVIANSHSVVYPGTTEYGMDPYNILETHHSHNRLGQGRFYSDDQLIINN